MNSQRFWRLHHWLLAFAGPLCLGGVFVIGPGPRGLARWIGLVLSLAGLAGVLVSRFTLGRSFSVMPKATELVTGGIYSRVRNPLYVSSIVFLVGFFLMLRLRILALALIVVIPMQVLRARRESRVLEARFGEAYRRYRERTWF